MNIAIVGAGPVGIYLAKLLLDSKHEITLIDSGNLNEESSLLTNKNYLFQSNSAMPAGVHRIGGGSLKWHARISEFLEDDFVNWPIKKSHLKDHYIELYKFLESGNFNDDEIIEKYFAIESLKLSPEFRLRSFRFCDPKFFIKLFEEIQNHKRMNIMMEYFCVKAIKNHGESSLNLELLNKDLKTTILQFDKVIIAGGAFQSTALVQRTLENLQMQKWPNTGSFLMEHLEGYIGFVRVSWKKHFALLNRISLDKKNRSINNFNGIGVAISINRYNLNKKVLNTQYEIRKFMPGPYLSVLFKQKHNVKWLSWMITIVIFWEKSLRFSGRKIREFFEFITMHRTFSIYLKSEEFPFVDSKLYLTDISQNLITYDHRISDETYSALLNDMEIFKKIFWEKFGLKIRYKIKLDSIDNLRSLFGSNWHPMGSLRMGYNFNDSVCDSNLEIHNFKNLFVVSAAVFPSGSNTNPTFTTLALARRLALSKNFDHN